MIGFNQIRRNPNGSTSHTQPLIFSHTTTRQFVIERFKTHLRLAVSSYSCTADQVFDVLIPAAVTHQTIETVCQELHEMVDGETIQGYLNDQIKADDLLGVEQQANKTATLSGRWACPRRQGAADRIFTKNSRHFD